MKYLFSFEWFEKDELATLEPFIIGSQTQCGQICGAIQSYTIQITDNSREMLFSLSQQLPVSYGFVFGD